MASYTWAEREPDFSTLGSISNWPKQDTTQSPSCQPDKREQQQLPPTNKLPYQKLSKPTNRSTCKSRKLLQNRLKAQETQYDSDDSYSDDEYTTEEQPKNEVPTQPKELALTTEEERLEKPEESESEEEDEKRDKEEKISKSATQEKELQENELCQESRDELKILEEEDKSAEEEEEGSPGKNKTVKNNLTRINITRLTKNVKEDRENGEDGKKSKDDILNKNEEEDLENQLNKLMKEQSWNESSEDDLPDGEILKTTDASGVVRSQINSTLEEEIRAKPQPADKPSTNEEIMEVKKPEEETTLNCNDWIEEEELQENDQQNGKLWKRNKLSEEKTQVKESEKNKSLNQNFKKKSWNHPS